MLSQQKVQEFVHALEVGFLARWIRIAVVIVALVTLSFIMLTRFRGLSTPEGMEQAEIAREIARGNGFSTRTIRPLALWQFQKNKGRYPTGNIPDTFHAPLNPWLNSLFLRFDRKVWRMTPQITTYPCDILIARVAVVLFLLSVALNYFIAKRLFDARLAVIGMGLVVLCDAFWQFALSGLPQMLMLFLFSACVYVLVRALEASKSGGLIVPWTAAAGALFGLLALAHGLTIWIFAGALAYAAFALGRRHALLMLGVFVPVYAPWLARNYRVCGFPGGIALYAMLDGVLHSGGEWMRSIKPSFAEIGPGLFAYKLRMQALLQLDGIYGFLGAGVAAPLFIVSLLHAFKRDVIASFRWGLLLMGLGAFFGMCLFGLGEKTPFPPNDLYILFVPMMTYYGLAFFLALLGRLEINRTFVRIGLLSLVYVLSAFPLVNGLLESQTLFHWPPYAPGIISVIGQWTKPEEIVVSDMPWAVAWYADRKCLWLPTTMKQFQDISDYARLGSPLVGLYLTPVSGNARLRADVIYGEYSDWWRIIIGMAPMKGFPLQYGQRLPVHGECVYLSDWPRWQQTKNPQ